VGTNVGVQLASVKIQKNSRWTPEDFEGRANESYIFAGIYHKEAGYF